MRLDRQVALPEVGNFGEIASEMGTNGYGGEGGIRTRERLAPLRDFQSRPFVHSGTSPANRLRHTVSRLTNTLAGTSGLMPHLPFTAGNYRQ